MFVPQEHAPGGEAEVDFGDVWVILAGVKTRSHMFTFRLSHSGKAIHLVYSTQGQEAFLMELDRRGAELLFQVLTEREEKNSVALASNESFSGWTRTLTVPRLCAAIVDRLTFNGTIIETGTDSYRLAHQTTPHRPRCLIRLWGNCNSVTHPKQRARFRELVIQSKDGPEEFYEL